MKRLKLPVSGFMLTRCSVCRQLSVVHQQSHHPHSTKVSDLMATHNHAKKSGGIEFPSKCAQHNNNNTNTLLKLIKLLPYASIILYSNNNDNYYSLTLAKCSALLIFTNSIIRARTGSHSYEFTSESKSSLNVLYHLQNYG